MNELLVERSSEKKNRHVRVKLLIPKEIRQSASAIRQRRIIMKILHEILIEEKILVKLNEVSIFFF